MSQQGTWCDNLIIQALTDKRNTRIHITESNPLFAEINVTQTIHIGHIDELHYVSTVPFNFVPMSIVTNTVMVRDKLRIKPGSEPGSELGSELGSKPGSELGSQPGSELRPDCSRLYFFPPF